MQDDFDERSDVVDSECNDFAPEAVSSRSEKKVCAYLTFAVYSKIDCFCSTALDTLYNLI